MTADLIKGLTDLAERGHLHGIHQGGKDVLPLFGLLLQRLECAGRLVLVTFFEVAQVCQPLVFLCRRRASQLVGDFVAFFVNLGIQVGVDADNRQLAGMFLMFVEQGFLLNFAALVLGLHGAEDAAAFVDTLEFSEHCLFNQVGELLDNQGALQRVLVLGQAELLGDDHLDRHGAPHRLFRGGGDRFVVSIGMQRVAIVVNRQ